MPAVALAVVATGVIARLSRSAMLEVLRQDFIRTARAKGVHERGVIWRHALKAAMVSIIPVLGMQAGFVLSGAVYIEIVFQWPGVGRMLVRRYPEARHPARAGRRGLRRRLLCPVQLSPWTWLRASLTRGSRRDALLGASCPEPAGAGRGHRHGAGRVLAAVVTPLLPLADPDVTDTSNRFQPLFSEDALLGTDHLGRDLLSRLMWGNAAVLGGGLCRGDRRRDHRRGHRDHRRVLRRAHRQRHHARRRYA